MQDVYMVCGVPAAGKSWVCEQLKHRFTYVDNDKYIGNKTAHWAAILNAAEGSKLVLVDCPFAERELKERLEEIGLKVHPFFIITPVETVKERYALRGNGPLPQASVTRATSILNRANEWDSPRGSSAEILSMLQAISD